MKLSSNMEHRSVTQPIRMYIEEVGKKKVANRCGVLFLFGSFFLAQAVLFDAAVPFFLPIWALARARYRKQLIWVFIGGMAGSALSGVLDKQLFIYCNWVFLISLFATICSESCSAHGCDLYFSRSSRLAICDAYGSVTGRCSTVYRFRSNSCIIYDVSFFLLHFHLRNESSLVNGRLNGLLLLVLLVQWR